MLRIVLSLLLFASFLKPLFSQQINSWTDYFSLNRLYHLDQYEQGFVAAGKNALLIYDTLNNEVEKKSFFLGLSDSRISGIRYLPDYNFLVVIYETGNIDILKDGKNYNLPYIMEDQSIYAKQLNDVDAGDNYVYVAGNYGVSSINPQTLAFYETCRFPEPVRDLAVAQGKVYALSGSYIYSTESSNSIIDINSWSKIQADNVFEIQSDGERIYAGSFVNGQTLVYVLENGSFNQVFAIDGLYKFKVYNRKLYLFGKNIVIYDPATRQSSILNLTYADVAYANDLLVVDGTMVIADAYNGLVFPAENKTVKYPSALTDNVSAVKTSGDYLYIGYTPDSIDELAGVGAMITKIDREHNQWQNYFYPVSSGITAISIDAADDNHIFAGTDGQGLLEVEGGELLAVYNSSNSPLGSANGQTAISDLFRDKSGTLWVLSRYGQYPVVKFFSDGTWDAEPLSAVAAGYSTGRFFLGQNNILWANLYEGGVLAIDYNNDLSRVFYPEPQVGKAINYVSQDKDGTVWLATTDGIAYLNFSDIYNVSAVRPKVEVTLNDTTIYAYLLDNVKCSRILSDPGNRKWITTTVAGVFLLSPDVQQQYQSFSRFNGKLPTNNVQDAYIDNKSGTIFFLTDLGLVSYKSDVSAANDDFAKIKIYPNPVRPGFEGNVAITGLMYNTLVKITDVEGNVVFETRSNGGTAVWDTADLRGNPVKSGVYLVFCYDDQYTQKCIKKLLIIR